MLARLLLSLVIWCACGFSLMAQDDPRAPDPKTALPITADPTADCAWQPFALFTNAYVKSPPPAAKEEPLYLRREPSYAAVLSGTEPFDWANAACVLPPELRLRIADWGKPKDRFAKVYYGGLIFWVSKTYRDGSPSLTSVTAATSSASSQKHTRAVDTQPGGHGPSLTPFAFDAKSALG